MTKDYNISKTDGLCLTCRKPLEGEEEFFAVVREIDQEFIRQDYCLNCWDQNGKPEGEDKQDDGVELWQMHFRGSNQMHQVIDPKMDEDKIAEVSEQLTQILNGEL